MDEWTPAVHADRIGGALLREVEAFRVAGTAKLDASRRGELGQFLTPIALADFMAGMFGDLGGRTVRLLEGGAGVGSLIAAFCVEAIRRKRRPKAISVVAYEIEARLIPHLRRTLTAVGELCRMNGVAFDATVLEQDFIVDAVAMLEGGLFATSRRTFDVALLNPPYGKIRSDSSERALLSRAGIEASNLYAAFVALAVKLLAPDGELVAITPRSFCNGPYFQPFRELFLDAMALRRLHVFESRDQAFADDKVLQENVIMHAVKSGAVTPIEVSMSVGVDDDLIATRQVARSGVVGARAAGSVIRIVPDEIGDAISNGMAAWANSLDDLEVAVSTGRVVDFRVEPFLRGEPDAQTVPLIYPGHFDGDAIRWPRAGFKKPNAIVACAETRALLFPRGTYVVVKRLSSKEERRRIVAAVYEPTAESTEAVAFENHVNVFHAAGAGLVTELARGLCGFLNSGVVDAAFRQFNGHTQVNATDLRSLRYPSATALCRLGRRLPRGASLEAIDKVVAEELLGMAGARAMNIMKRIDETQTLLKELGLPKGQQNERSALTLLALLDLGPTTSWAKAKAPLRGVSPMMEFFRTKYGKNYAPNSREQVRRSTVHQFVDAAIALRNPDKMDRPTTSGDTVYQIAPAVLALIRTFGTPGWNARRDKYLSQVPALAVRYRGDRDMVRIPVQLPGGRTLTLSAGGQNPLIKTVVEEFCDRFARGAEVLYLGDAGEKWVVNEVVALAALGIALDPRGKMPDLIVYDRKKNWLLLIEAVTSHGPVDPKRHGELRALFAGARAGLVFVTALPDRKLLAKYVGAIAWETEVWVADNPTHLIHFDGERFLGPYPDG